MAQWIGRVLEVPEFLGSSPPGVTSKLGQNPHSAQNMKKLSIPPKITHSVDISGIKNEKKYLG